MTTAEEARGDWCRFGDPITERGIDREDEPLWSLHGGSLPIVKSSCIVVVVYKRRETRDVHAREGCRVLDERRREFAITKTITQSHSTPICSCFNLMTPPLHRAQPAKQLARIKKIK